MAGRIEAEAQLRAVTADFEQAAQRAALGEFTASIGHEIRQPLSATLTNAQTTQRWLTRETPNLEKANQLLTRVAASARRASDVIDRVQHAAGNRAPVQAPLDLNEVVRESLLFVRQESDDGDVRIHLELAPDLPLILGDRGAIATGGRQPAQQWLPGHASQRNGAGNRADHWRAGNRPRLLLDPRYRPRHS